MYFSWVQNFGDDGLGQLLILLKRLQEDKEEYS